MVSLGASEEPLRVGGADEGFSKAIELADGESVNRISNPWACQSKPSLQILSGKGQDEIIVLACNQEEKAIYMLSNA